MPTLSSIKYSFRARETGRLRQTTSLAKGLASETIPDYLSSALAVHTLRALGVCGGIDETYDDHRVQRASCSRSLVDYLTRLGWCQDVKAKEGYLAGSPGTLFVQFWAAKGVLEHHEHSPCMATPLWCACLKHCCYVGLLGSKSLR